MKFALLRVLIAVSLVANVVLATKFASRFADHLTRAGHTFGFANAAPSSSKSAKPELLPLAPDTWARLAVDGDSSLSAHLLAAGFPRNVARAMIDVRVHERLADLEKIIADARVSAPFWRQHLRWTYADEKIRSAERALSRERTEITRQLWDDLDERDESNLRQFRMFNGNLSADSILAVNRVREGRMQQMTEIKESAGGIFFRDEFEQLSQLDRDDTKAVAGVLTPDEFAELDRRLNPTSRRIRSNLRVFEPTTEELHALVELQQPFDEQCRDHAVLSTAQAQARATARAQLNRQTEALLGTERFAAYLDAADKDWLQASRFTLAHQLPPSATEQILAIQSDFIARINHSDYLPGNRRESCRAALLAEATDRLTTALGVENTAAYRDGPGAWFRRLQPAPKTAP